MQNPRLYTGVSQGAEPEQGHRTRDKADIGRLGRIKPTKIHRVTREDSHVEQGGDQEGNSRTQFQNKAGNGNVRMRTTKK